MCNTVIPTHFTRYFMIVCFNARLQHSICRCTHAWILFDEYIICKHGLEEEIAKVFGPREGESRVTRPQNIKTPSARAAPATRLVLSRAGKTLVRHFYVYVHTHTHTHVYKYYIISRNRNKMYPYIDPIV